MQSATKIQQQCRNQINMPSYWRWTYCKHCTQTRNMPSYLWWILCRQQKCHDKAAIIRAAEPILWRSASIWPLLSLSTVCLSVCLSLSLSLSPSPSRISLFLSHKTIQDEIYMYAIYIFLWPSQKKDPYFLWDNNVFLNLFEDMFDYPCQCHNFYTTHLCQIQRSLHITIRVVVLDRPDVAASKYNLDVRLKNLYF